MNKQIETAPERIWIVGLPGECNEILVFTEKPPGKPIEYVRADLTRTSSPSAACVCDHVAHKATGECETCKVTEPPGDPTRFLDRSFVWMENKGHSVRLIQRDQDDNDPRKGISIKWEDLSALRELITLALEDGPMKKVSEANSILETERASSERQLQGQPTHEWAFDIEDRGFRVRGSYQDELGNNIEITRGGRPFKALTYPGYRIWNIAAHFHYYVTEWLAKDDAMWREMDSQALKGRRTQ